MDAYVENCSLFTISTWFVRPISTLIGCIRGFVGANGNLFALEPLKLLDDIENGTRSLEQLHGHLYVYFESLVVFSHIWMIIIKAGYKSILDDYGVLSIIRHNPQYTSKLCPRMCPKTTVEYFEYILRSHFSDQKYRQFNVPAKIMSEIPIKTETLCYALSDAVDFAKGTCAQTIYEIASALYKLCSDYVAN